MMSRVHSALRSETFVLVALVMALSAQMPHTAKVFSGLSDDPLWHGWLYAFALESAVLIFAVRGKIYISWGAASFSVAINLSYYATQNGNESVALSVFSIWLVAISLPVAIAIYSDITGHATATQQNAVAPVAVVEPDPEPTLQLQVDASETITTAETRKMTTAERRERIAEMPDATVTELAEMFEVSPSTISRDRQKE